MGGKRRKPYAVRIIVGYTDEGKQQYKYLGYYEKITKAKIALRNYLVNPYDLMQKDVTLYEVFERWEKETDIADKTKKNYVSAFHKAERLYKIPMRDLKEWYMISGKKTDAGKDRIIPIHN